MDISDIVGVVMRHHFRINEEISTKGKPSEDKEQIFFL